MAGHHRHIFCPLILLQIRFRKTKVFFRKKILSSANFIDFSKFKIFTISAKTLISGGKRPSYETNSFDTQFTANLPPLPILKIINFFEKKTIIFRI